MKEVLAAIVAFLLVIATYVGVYKLGEKHGVMTAIAAAYIQRAMQLGYQQGYNDAMGAVDQMDKANEKKEEYHLPNSVSAK